jgi:hypothetical protein
VGVVNGEVDFGLLPAAMAARCSAGWGGRGIQGDDVVLLVLLVGAEGVTP